MSSESKYRPEFGDIAIEMMSQGKSIAEFCATIRISPTTVRRWRDPNASAYKPEFAEKIELALILSEAWWTDLGRRAVLGEIKCHPTFWIFNMKNRFGWKDNAYVETKSEQEVKLSDMSENERKQRLMSIFKENGFTVENGKIKTLN